MNNTECVGVDNWRRFAFPFRRNPLVYSVHCMENNKFYIGQTSNLSSRAERYKSGLKRGVHDTKSMQEDYNRYGPDAFKIVIELLGLELDFLKEYERQILDIYLEKFDKELCYNNLTQIYRLSMPNILPEEFWRFIDIKSENECWVNPKWVT